MSGLPFRGAYGLTGAGVHADTERDCHADCREVSITRKRLGAAGHRASLTCTELLRRLLQSIRDDAPASLPVRSTVVTRHSEPAMARDLAGFHEFPASDGGRNRGRKPAPVSAGPERASAVEYSHQHRRRCGIPTTPPASVFC